MTFSKDVNFGYTENDIYKAASDTILVQNNAGPIRTKKITQKSEHRVNAEGNRLMAKASMLIFFKSVRPIQEVSHHNFLILQKDK